MKLLRFVPACSLALVLSATPATVRAQDNPQAGGDLNAKFQDALNQLKAAQDRKNELAGENEKLKARIADLEQQQEETNRQQSQIAESTWQLRMENAAWRTFLSRHPKTLTIWKLFLQADPLAAPTTLPADFEPITLPLQSD